MRPDAVRAPARAPPGAHTRRARAPVRRVCARAPERPPERPRPTRVWCLLSVWRVWRFAQRLEPLVKLAERHLDV